MKNINQNTSEKIKYFVYCRKSSEQKEKQALSIESQREIAQEILINLETAEVVEVLEESKSAFTPGRPVFNNMIKRIKNGEAQGIIAWHPDRLSRNEMDAATITYMIRTGEIKDLKFGSYNFDNSPEGIWMLQMALSQSQYDSAKKGRDVKRGLEKKIKMGWLPGVPPPGYMTDKFKDKGKKEIIKDPLRFPLIEKAWDLMLTGNFSPPEILRKLNNECGYRTTQRRKIGNKPLSRSTIYQIFTNPFYYGWFEYQNQLWEGAHEAMITEEEFDRTQVLLGRKGRSKSKKYNFLYTGTIRCGGCGAMITADQKDQIICSVCKYKFSYKNIDACPKCGTKIEKMKKPTILRYLYYHCTKRKDPKCKQGSIVVETLEKQFDKYLADIEIDEDYKNFAIENLNKVRDPEKESRNNVFKSNQIARENCAKKIDNLTKLKISPDNSDGSLISDQEFKQQKTELLKEKSQIEKILNGPGQLTEEAMDHFRKSFNFACYARYWFANGEPERKKQIFNALGSNLKLKDKKLTIQVQKTFRIISENKIAALPAQGEMIRFEPEKMGINKQETADLSAVTTLALHLILMFPKGMDYLISAPFIGVERGAISL
jgi:DNA invertase Pin-like site-specific DNA recombinase